METDLEINSTSSSSPIPIQSRPKQQNNPSPSESPAASPAYNLNQQFNIPALPEYPGGQNGPDIAASDGSTASQAVLLGIQELERQQAQLELKRQIQAQNVLRENPFETVPNHNIHSAISWKKDQSRNNRPQDSGVPMTVHVTDPVDDELTTESEVKNPAHPANPSSKRHSRINSIGRLLKTPLKPIRRSITEIFNNDPTPTRIPSEPRIHPIICGYLHKLGRNNKWQNRWFESNGKELKYFKSKKKEKCLATLSLLRVGSISMDFSDHSGCTFTIEVAGRQYYLCTDTKGRAQDWVIMLNRAKEARAQVGGLKYDFVYEGKKQLQHRSPSGSDSDDENVVARVVMNAARPRTRGLGNEDFSDMDMEDEDKNLDGQIVTTNTTMSPSAGTRSLASSQPRHLIQHPHLNMLPPNMQHQVAVRWNKQRSAVQNLARRLSRWTKRMTMARCVIQNDIVHLNSQSMQQQHAFGAADLQDSGNEDNEEPFIDLDSARYSYCQESYIEVHGNFSDSSKQKYDFVDHSITSSNLQKSSSWNMQKNDPPVASTGSSIQSSSGRISPIPADDDSRIIA